MNLTGTQHHHFYHKIYPRNEERKEDTSKERGNSERHSPVIWMTNGAVGDVGRKWQLQMIRKL